MSTEAFDEDVDIRKGLDGVIVDTTAISKVMVDTNSLTYRGYPVQDLAANCIFEEVAHLLWDGDLPTAAQLAAFSAEERKHRALSDDLVAVIRRFPKGAHPMDSLRTAVSFLAMEDPEADDNSDSANRHKALKMMAKIPTIIATDYRVRNGLEVISPRDDLTFTENFFHMCFGAVPEPEVLKCFDISMTLYAEHSFNASTFAARVAISTLSDIYAAVVAAIGTLKGPLHGGANEAVMEMLLEIDDPAKARAWMEDALENKRKVMGFGHRVYKRGDSRVPTMHDAFLKMAQLRNGQKWVEIEDILKDVMVSRKNIYPNLDYPAGPAYYLMGFEIKMFTPIFVMSRITGWTAHVIEQLSANKLIRPVSHYIGHEERPFVPLDRR